MGASARSAGPGQPRLPTRLVAGLLILKQLHDLSVEALCARSGETGWTYFWPNATNPLSLLDALF